MTSGPFAPAGWYEDPSGEHASRYWDGSAWTDHVSEVPPAPSGGAADRKSSAPVLRFVVSLVGLLLVASIASALMFAAFGPDPADFSSPDRYNAAVSAEENEAQLFGILLIFVVVALVAPKVGYRLRDVGFMLVPIYSLVFLVRILWRAAHLSEAYWSTRT